MIIWLISHTFLLRTNHMDMGPQFKVTSKRLEKPGIKTMTHCLQGKGLNPYLTNGLSHHYQLGESTFIFRGVKCDFYLIF